MVKSKLSQYIEYPESRNLLNEDKNHEASLYEITLFDKDETIALGQPIYSFIERNVIYYPIYLVKNNKVSLQIGLYEIFADGIVNILDADGDIDLDLIGKPLLYSFVYEELNVIEKKHILSTEKKELTAKEQLEPQSFPEQTEEDAIKERSLYIANKENNWFQRYMENNNYRIIDNEGRGDCLFATIRDGLATVGIHKSVEEMRNILSDNVTEDIYKGYKTIYQDAAETDMKLVNEIKVLVTRHKDLKTKADTIKDRNEKQSIIAQADEIKKRHTNAKSEREYTKSVVEGELKMMKNIHNLTQFKSLIKTCSFWGDTWAISTLERVLNIKLILFSEENYKVGDIDNVLTCGQLNDTVLEDKGVFQPNYYILTLYQGYHYQLIMYKNKGALTFTELPYDVKIKVVDKCLERLAGPYYIIPDFRKLMEKLKGIDDIKHIEETHITPLCISNAQNNIAVSPIYDNNMGVLNEKECKTTDVVENQSELFNNFTIFQFYSKSANKLPGKGVGETIAENEKNDYTELSHISEWRKKLDNFWISPFTLDGHKWQSVEHYYQGSKYKRNQPDFYLKFSLDSDSELSKDPIMAKENGNKLNNKTQHKNIVENKELVENNKKIMELAQYAKFTQNEDLKLLLKATKKAMLQHFSKGSPPKVCYELMRVRQKLLQKK